MCTYIMWGSWKPRASFIHLTPSCLSFGGEVCVSPSHLCFTKSSVCAVLTLSEDAFLFMHLKLVLTALLVLQIKLSEPSCWFQVRNQETTSPFFLFLWWILVKRMFRELRNNLLLLTNQSWSHSRSSPYSISTFIWGSDFRSAGLQAHYNGQGQWKVWQLRLRSRNLRQGERRQVRRLWLRCRYFHLNINA